MADTIDINVYETTEEVTINVTPNVIEVNINKVTGGGGGTQTLAQTLDLGNTTGGENISISNGDAIILDNGSMLKKGTIDAGNGGAKGISQICGVGFEHKWEAGRLYIMNDGGTIIREVSHNLTYTPTVTDDVTKGFVQNTRWILDNGDVYVCSDPTEGAAVWDFVTGVVPTLQQVTDEGNETNQPIKVIYDGNSLTELRYNGLYFEDLVDNGTTILRFLQTSASDQQIEIRGEGGTMALLSDIPAAQVNSDWNATSGVAEILNKPTIPTNTSDLTNDGSDGVNPFITALDIPTTGQASTIVREVKNMTGATLTKGTVVYISGANGNKPLVSKAIATTDALSARTFGLLQSNISNNGLGYCVIIGDLSGLNTSSFADGDQLYLSGVTAGTFTSTKTLAPTHLVYIGKVTRSHPTQGQIEVQIQNGYELNEIHDVAISSVADKQLLSYDSSTSLWKNKSVTTADIADSTNKRYQTDNQNSFNDATSSIQTQLNSKQATLGYTPFKWVNTSASTHTGTLSETIIATATINGGTFNANDIMKIVALYSKGVTLGTTVARVKINTTNSLSGAVGIARLDLTITNTYGKMNRDFAIQGGNIIGYNQNSSIASDSLTSNNGVTSASYNPANTIYVFFTITLGNVADVVTYNLQNITN